LCPKEKKKVVATILGNGYKNQLTFWARRGGKRGKWGGYASNQMTERESGEKKPGKCKKKTTT